MRHRSLIYRECKRPFGRFTRVPASENVIRMNITNSVSEIGEILPRAELAAKRQRSPLGGSCEVPHDSVVAVVERTQC